MASVGTSVGRLDGTDKVTGAARYVDDLTLPGMLHGATVRSTEPRGRLLGIRWDPGFDWSRVVRVTADDIPGDNVVTLFEDDQPVLAHDEVRHPTEPVALVAAPDKDLLADALAHVEVVLEPLEPVFDPLESEVELCTIDLVKGDVEAGLSAADLVVDNEYRTGAQEQMYLEPQGMLAVPADDGGIRVLGSLQCPYFVHRAVKRALDLPDERVEIVQTVTGGAFGGKEEYPSILACHAALLARKAGRPVKVVYDRHEDILATPKRHPSVIRIRHGVRKDGTLTGVDVEVIFDGGAYLTVSKVVLMRGVLHTVGPYRCDHVRVRARAMLTHTPPTGAFRGFGAPQTTFAYERQMDRIAEACGLTPLEVRRRNQVVEGDRTATSQTLAWSVGSEQVLQAALEASGYEARHAELAGRPADGPVRRGIGLCFYFHGAGFTGGADERMTVDVAVDLLPGGRVRLRTGCTEMGQGLRTVFPQILADTLEVPLELVEFEETSTAKVPDSGPTVASRTTMVVGKTLQEAGRALLRAVDEHADPSLPWTERADAALAARGELSVTESYKGPGESHWDEATCQGDAYPCYAWACDVVEVSVDTDTGEVGIDNVWAAFDVGKAIHPVQCATGLEGGTLQGLGLAALEEVKMKDGRPWTDRMTTCIIPTSMDTPPLEAIVVEVPYHHGPFGAKGVGELPTDGVAPAVAAAVEQATGIRVDRVPITPEAVLEGLREGGRP